MQSDRAASQFISDDSRQDRDYLLVLTLFHYIMSGFGVLSAIAACFYVAVATNMPAHGMPPGFATPAAGAMGAFIGFHAVSITAIVALAVAMFIAGRCLSRRRGYRFCLCVACAECLLVGFGTLLGVLTIVVLRRPSVRRLFGVAADPR